VSKLVDVVVESFWAGSVSIDDDIRLVTRMHTLDEPF